MKIALIDPALFTWPYDKALMDGLTNAGHEVTLYSKYLPASEPGAGDPRLVSCFYPGLHTKLAGRLPRKVFLVLKGLLHIVGMAGLVLRLARQKPDVIHVQWAPLPVVDQFFVPWLKRIAPVVFTVHDSSPFNNNPGSGLQRIGAISIFSRYDQLIVHTEHARQKLLSYGLPAERLALIAHGPLELQSDAPAAAPLPVRGPDDPVTLLLFGKLKPYKGCDLLLRAIAGLTPELRRRARLRVVGKAEMPIEPLQQLASELGITQQIQWDLRFVTVDEKPLIYAQADIIAMPYREIDASGVFMEILAVGRPILASRIGLFAELLEEGKHSALAAPENVAELTAALTKLMQDEPLRRHMGQAVRDLAGAIPSWEQIAQQTLALYQNTRQRR